MDRKQKFSSKLNSKNIEGLRELSKQTNRSISSILDEAVGEHINRSRVRPAFRDASEHVLNKHQEILRRLAN